MSRSTSSQPKRTERGWTAHFIDGQHCRFSRNTLLEYGDARYVISTVGAYYPSEHDGAIKINTHGYYETLVFKAKREEPYWDADTEVPMPPPDGMKWYVKGISFVTDQEANDMHESAVDAMGKLMTGYPNLPTGE